MYVVGNRKQRQDIKRSGEEETQMETKMDSMETTRLEGHGFKPYLPPLAFSELKDI